MLAALVLTLLPGAWITYGLRLSGLPMLVRPALALALSPAVLGLQLLVLEACGIPFAAAALALVFLNLPCLLLVAYRCRAAGILPRSWHLPWPPPWRLVAPTLLFTLLAAIPLLIWSRVPGLRTYTWNAMIQTDVIYTIARDGIAVEETNLAGLNLAYGWLPHSYWSVLGWLGSWAPTTIYPWTNLVCLAVTFTLCWQLARSGLALARPTALLAVTLTFLATNVLGMLLLLALGYSDWWERSFGDIRYTPLLSKFYAFDTMILGMALLAGLAVVCTVALRRRLGSFPGLLFALLTGLGLTYPVLAPAGLVVAGCFLLLLLAGVRAPAAACTRGERLRLVLAVLASLAAILFYLGLVTADRDAAHFARSTLPALRTKGIRFLGAVGPFLLLAALPLLGSLRRRARPLALPPGDGPLWLLALSSAALCAAYLVVDLVQLEYKYILAATICLAPLAAGAFDPLFRRRPRLGWSTAAVAALALAGINLLLVLHAGAHLPGSLAQGVPLDESAFWIRLQPSNPDRAWTDAIRAHTAPDTVVIARQPGVDLAAVVARSLYIPSDLEGGFVPGYNLDQRFYLLRQRGYSAAEYDRRLAVAATLYSSRDDAELAGALHALKALHRPIALCLRGPDAHLLHWLAARHLGRPLLTAGPVAVWYFAGPDQLP